MTQSTAELSANAAKQLRVPKGNGALSGRFVDDPRTSTAELSERLTKKKSPAAPLVKAVSDQLADLEPSDPQWYPLLDEAIGELEALGDLGADEQEWVGEVVDRLFALQNANFWASLA